MALLALVVAVIYLLRQNEMERWRALADELGLEHSGRFPLWHAEITGRRRNHYVELCEVGGRGWSGVLARVYLNRPQHFGMVVFERSFSNWLNSDLGGRDFQTLDTVFDSLLRIHCEAGASEAAVREYLRAQLREMLVEAIEHEPDLIFCDAGMQVVFQHWPGPPYLGKVLDRMEQICEVADDGAPAPNERPSCRSLSAAYRDLYKKLCFEKTQPFDAREK